MRSAFLVTQRSGPDGTPGALPIVRGRTVGAGPVAVLGPLRVLTRDAAPDSDDDERVPADIRPDDIFAMRRTRLRAE